MAAFLNSLPPMPSQRASRSTSNAIDSRRTRLAAAVQAQTVVSSKQVNSDALEVVALDAFRLREPTARRQYTVIKVRTRSGILGFGETDLISPDELIQAREILLGSAATAYETVRQRLAALPNLQAAANLALLDIVGKHTRAPIHHLLGGPTRSKVRVMAALTGDSNDALLDSTRRAKDAGFRAFVAPVPAPSAPNQGQAYARAARQRLDKLREIGGEDVDFVLDGASSLSPGDASSLAAALERFHLLWFDEPCRVSNLSTLRKIAHESVTPLGLGRQIHHAGDFQDLLREEVIDVLRPSLSWNGLTQIRKMAALAEAYYVAIAPYHDGGPIGVAAALHLAASLPNFFIQQVPLAGAEADRKMRAELVNGWQEKVEEGFAALPTEPGLGVTVNETALEKYRG